MAEEMSLAAIEESSTSLPICGMTLFWRLSGIRVNRQDLEAALTATPFLQHLPKLPTPRKALRRTLEAWIAERTRKVSGKAVEAGFEGEGEEDDDEKTQRNLIRVLNRRGAAHMVFALVEEDVDFSALGLSYGTQLRILLDKATGQILCTTEARGAISAGNETESVARELQPLWQEFRGLYLSADLSRMMRNIIAGMKAVSLRREGGVYFVPADQREKVESLRRLVSSLPTRGASEPYVCALGVPDERAAKRQLARAIHFGFVDEVKLMATDLERFIEAKPGTVRMETISERLTSYKELRKKVEVYADLLEMQHTDIQKALDTLTEKARAVVLGGSPETPAREGKRSARPKLPPGSGSEPTGEIEQPAASPAGPKGKRARRTAELGDGPAGESESARTVEAAPPQTGQVQNRLFI